VAHDVVHRYREFGNHDHVRTAGESAHRGDPAGQASHRLDDHDAVMRRRRRVEPVDRFTHDADRGVKADAVVGAEQVVVEGLGHADDGRPVIGQPRRNSVRTVAANGDQRIEMLIDGGQHPFATARRAVEVVARGAEQRSALGDDALEVAREEGTTGVFAGQSGPAVGDADDFVSVAQGHLADGPDGRVEAGRVATRRKNTDAQCNSSEPNRLKSTQ